MIANMTCNWDAGLLYPSGDIDEAARLTRDLVANSEKRKAMGAAGRAEVGLLELPAVGFRFVAPTCRARSGTRHIRCLSYTYPVFVAGDVIFLKSEAA